METQVTPVIRLIVLGLVALVALLASAEMTAGGPLDSDGDGCSDGEELGPVAALGGLRDPLYYWDFFDQWTGAPPAKDATVAVGDIGSVVARFGTAGPVLPKPVMLLAALTPPVAATGYHHQADRGGAIPPEPWDLLPPDGVIAVGDIGAAVAQFGHSCALPP